MQLALQMEFAIPSAFQHFICTPKKWILRLVVNALNPSKNWKILFYSYYLNSLARATKPEGNSLVYTQTKIKHSNSFCQSEGRDGLFSSQ